MSQAALRHRTPRLSVPDEVGSAQAKLVYVYLGHAESASIEQLADDLGLSQLNLLPTVERLMDLGLALREGDQVRLCE